MATFIPLSPGLPSDIPVVPNLPQFTWNSGVNPAPQSMVPIFPLPGSLSAGSFAMGLAPLLLPLAALLSWWLNGPR